MKTDYSKITLNDLRVWTALIFYNIDILKYKDNTIIVTLACSSNKHCRDLIRNYLKFKEDGNGITK